MSKNAVIAVLAVAVAVLGAVVLVDRHPGIAEVFRPAPRGETVKVLDVVLDRERAYVDLVFDKPLGDGKVGEILGEDPATLNPPVGGSWQWQGANVLRFEPSQAFPMASRYALTLLPERVPGPGKALDGPTRFEFQTDQFRLLSADVFEEPAWDAQGSVIVRGELRFNYAVDPKVLVSKMRVDDPVRGGGKPLALTFETDWPNPVLAFRTEAVPKQRQERTLRLTVAAELTPVGGNVPLPEGFSKDVPVGSSEVLTVRGVTTVPGTDESSFRVEFSSAVAPEAAAPFVTITPKIETTVSADRNTLVVSGRMRSGESYVLELAPGLPGVDGSKLREARREEIRLADLEPSADFESRGMFLSASGWRSVAVESVNVDRLLLTVDRVFRNNLFVLFQYHGWQVGEDRAWQRWDDSADADDGEGEGSGSGVPAALGDRLAKKSLAVRAPRNGKARTVLHLDDFVKGEPGLYRVAVGRDGTNDFAQRWLLVTDLGIVAKHGVDDVAVWVSSFADLKPAAGAEVRVFSDKNQLLAKGRTGEDGLWRQAGLEEAFRKQKPFLVTVERGTDFSFLMLRQSGVDFSGLDVGGAAAASGAYDAFVYGERDLYRPGESVRGVAILRDRGLDAPPAMPVTLRHRDPLGREMASYAVTVGKQGAAAFDIPVLGIARTGPHTLEAIVANDVVGRWRFQVEEFVPDRIKVDLATKAAALAAGQPLAFDVAGDYLFGAPAAGLPVEARVKLRAAPFAPAGVKGFVFGNPERSFSETEVLNVSSFLDGAGRASFTAEIASGLRPPAALDAEIVARVREEGGRGVAAIRKVRVDPYPHYIGLRPPGEGSLVPGRPAALSFVVLDPKGAKTRPGPLRLEFLRDRWNTVLRRTASGTWRYETTRVPQLVEVRAVPAAAEGTVQVTPSEYGNYRAVLTDTTNGASTSIDLDAWGWGYTSWAMKEPDRLELSLDREEYASGETATLQVKSPFPGRMLLSVERDRVLELSTHTLAGNTATIPIAVKAAWTPNVHVTAVLVRRAGDVEPGGAARAVGAVALRVDRTPNRIDVKVDAPATARPRAPLRIEVAAGRGAVVTVAAVDEGILQLVAQKTPDPFEYFYRRIGLGVRSFDIWSQLLPEDRRRESRSARGGDEALLRAARMVRTEGIRRVEPVAFWSGVLETDAQGKATATFTLPEFQGALRVMAVAVRGRAFGSTEASTRVRDPIVLLPTAPRVLAPGDAVVLPVTVRNDTDGDAAISLELRAAGPIAIDRPKLAVRVPKGAGRPAAFTANAGDAAGDVSLVWTARAGEESTRAETKFLVRYDLPARSVEAAGLVERDTFEVVSPGAAVLRGGGVTRDLSIGPLPVVALSGKLGDLIRYPYGCLEQTVSTAFPLVYLSDLARAVDPKAFEHGDPAVMVQSAIRRLATMQQPSGGFSMWPNGDTTAPWPSLYAAHFLVEARQAGFLVDSFLYDRAVVFAANEARIRASMGDGERLGAAYALYVLARAGKADAGSMDALRERHLPTLKPEARAALAAAYAASGNAKGAADLLRGLDDVDAGPRATGGTFDSTVRNRALLLLALIETAPGDPRVARLAGRLGREAGADPWTTQESGFAFVALGRLARRQSAAGPYGGTVVVGGKPLGTFGGETKTFRDLPAGSVTIRMNPGSPAGAAFYSLTERGVPTDAAFKPEASGLEIERAWLDRKGGAVDLSSVAQGDLLVLRTRVRSTQGPVANVAVVNLLPGALEVENPRLKGSETLSWVSDASDPAYLEARDDRVVCFVDLGDGWTTTYALVRAVHAGTFRVPPASAEAMYDPARRAVTERGSLVVTERR